MDGTLTPFNVGTGVGTGRSGRIKPSGWVPPDGSYVFCLGYDTPGRFESMRSGDAHTLSQSILIPTFGAGLVRVRARLRSPTAALPGGLSWVFSVTINSIEHTRRVLAPRRTRTLLDVAACVLAFAGSTVPIALKLALEGGAGLYNVELPGVYVDKVELV